MTNLAAWGFEPSNPNMSFEAKALLELYYQISGKYVLTGQHNYPNSKDRNTRFARDFYGETPVIWGSDFGFSKDGDKDAYTSRPEIVKETIRQHKKGSIIHLCWHAVPPTANEPITFRTQGQAEPGKLNSVQGHMLEEQYKDLLTPGTEIYNNWAKQVDTIASYLKKLQDAKVPVLWRPYHEMNGNWFWWGERIGNYSTIDIFRQLYDRLVNHHKLNNLVWVWNVDRPATPTRNFSNFYPGHKYADILSLDVYGSDFNQIYYDSLVNLADGRPILLGEVGHPPLTQILDKQPLWTSWMIWADMARNMTDEHLAMLKDPRVLCKEDVAYHNIINPYRKVCGLPALPLEDIFKSVNFSGKWILNKEKNDKRSTAPFLLIIDRDLNTLFVKKYTFSEYGEDFITYEEILLDGSEMRIGNQFGMNTSKANWDDKNKSLDISTISKQHWGDREFEIQSTEKWKLSNNGNSLIIELTTPDRSGKENTTVTAYDKH